MKWTVNIEGKSNQRIIIKFDPKNEVILFIGQYKPHNKEWVDFSEITHVMNIDLEAIKILIEKTYDLMKVRIDAYNNINEGFTLIKNIEIKEDEK